MTKSSKMGGTEGEGSVGMAGLLGPWRGRTFSALRGLICALPMALWVSGTKTL